MPPCLVILAAGLGRRFGGLKQMAALGPRGETMLDYALRDARRAGFGQAVFVIREDFADAFRARLAENPAAIAGLEIGYAYQDVSELPAPFAPPAGRDKPWGTGHAVWCARAAVARPFAVINADDFYGADSFRWLAAFLQTADSHGTDWAMAGFRLGRTLSEHGTVARGICQVDAAGYLTGLEEQTGLEPEPATGGARAQRADGAVASFAADTIVSMNCWAFTPALFPLLEGELKKFLEARIGDLSAEFYLPASVAALVAAKRARVRVLPTEATWFGVTHPGDQARVQAALRVLAASGE